MNFNQIKSVIIILIILGILCFVAYQHFNGDIIAPIKSSDNSTLTCPSGYHIEIHYRSAPDCYRNK